MPNFPDRPLSEDEWEAVRSTLDILQQSQLLVDNARQAICPVPGFADQWSDLSKAHESIRQAWDMIDERRLQLQNHENFRHNDKKSTCQNVTYMLRL